MRRSHCVAKNAERMRFFFAATGMATTLDIQHNDKIEEVTRNGFSFMKTEVVQMLLEASADVNVPSGKDGNVLYTGPKRIDGA